MSMSPSRSTSLTAAVSGTAVAAGVPGSVIAGRVMLPPSGKREITFPP